MRSVLIPVFFVLILGFFSEVLGQTSGIQRVWAIDDGERVKKTNLNHPLINSSNNPVWNGSSISLFAGRNEFVAFQLIIQGKSTGAVGVNVTLDSLYKSVAPQFTIKNTGGQGDPYNYNGKRVEMFVEHYMNITERSNSDFIWWAIVRPLPDADFMGLQPEQLVPFESPAGARTNGQGGAPFTVTANQNQGVWVDIYIPKNAQPGDYTGTLKVTESSVLRYSIPVNLKVYNFTLPDTTHIKNGFFAETNSILGRHGLSYGSSAYWSMVKKYYSFMFRHRANVNHIATPTEFSSQLAPVYKGQQFTAANNYDGPGVGLAPNYYMVGPFDQPNRSTRPDNGSRSGFNFTTDTNAFKQVWRDTSNWWVNWFSSNNPEITYYKYGPEEPGIENGNTDTSAFSDMRRKSRWLKTNPGPGRNLKYRSATNIRPDLRGVVDVWFSGGTQSGYVNPTDPWNPYPKGYIIDSANAARARGERVGLYGGTRPAYGTEAIDAPATDQRVNCWIMWKYGIDEYWYWNMNLFGDNQANEYNPWYKDKRWNSYGDGTIVYAGQNRGNEMGDDRGVPGPVAGIRLKNWRRGAQDYEYLWLASQLGLDVTAAVDSVVPAAFDRIPQTTRPKWAEKGYRFEKFRRQVAELIANTSSPLPYGTFNISPGELSNGPGNVTLSWTSVNAVSASIDHGVGAVSTSGSRVVFVDSTTTFTLTLANGQGNRTYARSVTVRRLPTGLFTATPDTLPPQGGSTTLSWSSSFANSASLSQGIGTVPVNGSVNAPVTTITTFSLTLTNGDGTRTYDVTVFPRTLPTGSFSATPDSIPAEGGEAKLVWTSTNALSAAMNHGIGTVQLADTLTLFLDQPASFTITLANPFGATNYSVNIYQRPSIPKFVSVPPESLVVKDPLTGRIAKPVRRGRSLFPNWANLLSEVVTQGGFQPGASESDSAGGLRVGVSAIERISETRWRPRQDIAALRSWVRLSKWNRLRNTGSSYNAIQSSLEDRMGKHVGTARGFDSTGAPGQSGRRKLHGEYKTLGPRKFNNLLYAELVALKVNIAASQLRKTPVGFGELALEMNGHPYDEWSINEIAAYADSMMTFWGDYSNLEFQTIYLAISMINRAFVSRMDTVNFESTGQLKLRGVVTLESVPFLKLSPNTEPMTIEPTTYDIGEDTEELDEIFDGDGNSPVVAKLMQNYPNPFNPSTTISFALRRAALVRLKVYDILGQEVETLLNDELLDSGIHDVEFAPGNVATGVYLYRLFILDVETGEVGSAQTQKMLLLK